MPQDDFSSIADVFKNKQTIKPPAYQWQELALWVIKELSVPNFKRSAVFKACKENTEKDIKQAVIDTKELCQTGQKWAYFFKVIAGND